MEKKVLPKGIRYPLILVFILMIVSLIRNLISIESRNYFYLTILTICAITLVYILFLKKK
jgi:hypothetical protein